MTISEYSPGLSIGQYKTTNYSTDLQSALLVKKQRDYDTVLSRLNGLKASGLNITMLNQEGQKKLDVYNQEIDNLLSQDNGDLTESDTQQRISRIFTGISSDTDLKQRSHLSKWYQTQLSDIERMKNDKDPTKSGYDPINEFVFKNWEGGLNDFIGAKDINRFSTQRQGYTPFKDVKQKLVNLTKLLHAEGVTTATVKDGRIAYESTEGVSPERIQQLLASNLTQDEISQMEIMSKYRLLTHSTPESSRELYGSYSNWIDQEHKNTESEMKLAQALAAEYDPSKVSSTLTGDARIAEVARYTQESEKYKNRAEALSNKLKQQTVAKLPLEQWEKQSLSERLPLVNQMMFEQQVTSVADALSWKKETQKVDSDQAYWSALKLSQMQQALEWKMGVEKAKLELQALKAGKDAGGSPSEEGYQIPSPVDLAGDFTKWTDQISTLTKSTTDLINSKDDKGNYVVSDQQLQDPKNKFVQKNSDNYYAKLWERHKLDNPNATRESFSAFTTALEAGNYKGNKAVMDLWSEKKNQERMRDYMKEEADRVMDVVYKSGDPLETKLGNYTIKDYAVPETRNSRNPSFMVNNGQGGYTSMTWEQVKKEYEGYLKDKEYRENEFKNSMPTQPTGASTEGWFNDLRKPFNDEGFFDQVENAYNAEKSKSKAIQNAWSKEAADFSQGTSISIDDEDVINQKYAPQIAKTLRATTGEGFMFGPKQITRVIVPSVFGTVGGFQVSKEAADGIRKNSANGSVPTFKGIDGNMISGLNLTENTVLMFDYDNKGNYDNLSNQVFKVRGEFSKTLPSGVTYTITRLQGSPTLHAVARDMSGKEVWKNEEIPNNYSITDIQRIIEQGLALKK